MSTLTVPIIDLLFEEDLPGGVMWSYALKRHHTLRLTATESGATVTNSALGYTKRDLTHNINFFMNVPVTPEGGLTFEDGVSDKGRYVEMQAEMDVIALISNCPQLNNPCNAYNPTPVQLLVWD